MMAHPPPMRTSPSNTRHALRYCLRVLFYLLVPLITGSPETLRAEDWPPKVTLSRKPLPLAPYLTKPPAVIPIDIGRQLFVDDYLVESTTLVRTHHLPE